MGFFKKIFKSNNDKGFEFLDNLIHSSSKEIVLDSDIILSGKEEFKYESGIKIDVDGLVIDGNGHIIDAKGKTRIFEILAKDILIKNITLKNANAGNGAAIFNQGESTIQNSILSENIGKWDGGAIFNSESGTLNIHDSFIQNNAAKSGGAICNHGELDIYDSEIYANSAELDGGAIFNTNSGQLKVYNGIFKNNDGNQGSIICNMDGNVKFMNSKVEMNESPNNIVINNDSLQFNNTVFEGNDSKSIFVNETSGNLNIFLGEIKNNKIRKNVLLNNGNSSSIKGSIFKDNNSSHRNFINIDNRSDLTLINPTIYDEGKTIFNEGHILVKKSSPELEDKIYGKGTVENDNVPDEEKFDFTHLDDLIHRADSKTVIINQDISLENYESDFYEGGIELNIDNMVIDGNGKSIDAKGKSRIFMITGNNITLKNIVFMNGKVVFDYDNNINVNGGALRICNGNDLTLKNCTFLENHSDNDGGSVHARYSEILVYETKFEGNSANGHGGAIFNTNGKIELKTSTFINNSSENCGGSIYAKNNEISACKTKFEGNSANGHGGAIFNTNGKIELKTSTFINNSSGNSGGSIYAQNNYLLIDNIKFKYNSCDNHGGAIFNCAGKIDIKDSDLVDNTSGKCGGSLYNHGQVFINNCELNNNQTLKSNGGAILNFKDSKLVIDNSVLKNNVAKSNNCKGGSLANYGELEITDSTLENNTAHDGGAIFNFNSSKLSIDGSKVNNNKSWIDGGAIYNDDAKTIIRNTSLSKNICGYYGDAIENKGKVVITDSKIYIRDLRRNIEMFNESNCDDDFILRNCEVEYYSRR